ncbi:hypothetical protein EWM64_g359 [Hericium alpestre]|uniref:Chromo domain-containing protein n=1 Tax=Hericium alpestre TaxID=135208 RepID=A0A4Z0AAA3_9AGAM|nr:hypothetical protein EWM64_g359 [Hericium alpestre]
MVRAHSGSESEMETEGKQAKASKRQSSTEADAPPETDNAEGSNEETSEPEYEIEAILDSKRGVFGKGSAGYLVKWKGFGDEENSWVSEEDASNAKDLIDEFWARHAKQKKTARVSEAKPAKGRPPSAKAESPAVEAAPAVKKRGRGRPSKTKPETDEEEEAVPAKKKSRPSNGTAAKGRTAEASPEEDESETAVPEVTVHPSKSKKYKDVANWERFVEKIDTVERSGEDELLVYFRMKDIADPCVEVSDVAAKHFPQTLIRFYESNLRWKSTDGGAEAMDEE